MMPKSDSYGDIARAYTTNTKALAHGKSVYDSNPKPAEVTIIEAGQYGQWSLHKSTVFAGMYTAKHPTHGEEWIDAPNDAAAIARFRRFVRSKGTRT